MDSAREQRDKINQYFFPFEFHTVKSGFFQELLGKSKRKSHIFITKSTLGNREYRRKIKSYIHYD